MPTRYNPDPVPPRCPNLPAGRQLVLVLSRRRGPSDILPFTDRSRHRSHHLVVTGPPGGEGGPTPDDADVLRSWRRIGSEFSSACLGIVAEAGAATAAVARILARGVEDGTLPGAVALLGYDPAIVEACLGPSGDGDRAGGPGRAGPRASPRRPSDCPPIAVFLRAGDPSLAACASACRRMRSAGIDVRLEVVAEGPTADDGAGIGALGADVIAEMDAFFEVNLEPCFPNMPREAS